MAPEKIIELVERYERVLREQRATKVRMNPKKSFGELTIGELFEHAYFLCDGVKEYARDPENLGKANSHLMAIQMCLSFADLYTLEELMDHNRS